MNAIILHGAAGLAAGGALLLLSHLVLRTGIGVVRDLDQLRLFGREYARRESHVIGMFIHVVLYAAAGIVFGALVREGMIAHDLRGLVTYAGLLTLVFGGVILPLEGHGLFGAREDAWFAIDLLIANAVWVILFEAVSRLIV